VVANRFEFAAYGLALTLEAIDTGDNPNTAAACGGCHTC